MKRRRGARSRTSKRNQEAEKDSKYVDASFSKTTYTRNLLDYLHSLPKLAECRKSHVVITEDLALQDFQSSELLNSSSPISLTCQNSLKKMTLPETIRLSPFQAAEAPNFGTLLNVGFPVWALDFSPVVSLGNGSSPFSVLAVSGCSYSRPVTLCQSQLSSYVSLIQFWKVDADTKKSCFAFLTTHENGYCKCLNWLPNSDTDAHVGILFAVFGNGKLCAYSIEKSFFSQSAGPDFSANGVKQLEQRVYTISPIWTKFTEIFRCVKPAPFYTEPTPLSSSDRECDQEDQERLCSAVKIAAGLDQGYIYVYFLTRGTMELADPYVIIMFSENSAVTCLSWLHSPELSLLVGASADGSIKIWDTRRPSNGCVHSFEGVKKYVCSVIWSLDARYISVCQGTARILVVPAKESVLVPAPLVYKKLKTEGKIEPTAWSCCALLGNVLTFVFDDGSVLVGTVGKASRSHRNFSRRITWELNGPSYVPADVESGPSLKLGAEKSSSTASRDSVSGLLLNYQQEVERFYSTGMRMSEAAGIKISIEKEYESREEKGGPPEMKSWLFSEVYEYLAQTSRLHASCALDPVICRSARPLIAYGGAGGVVHAFDPQELGII